jgi:hypothetical protein
MDSSLSRLLALILFPAGLIFARFAQPLFTGQEELVRWQTIVFSNKTMMYFIVLGGWGWLGAWAAARRPQGWQRWAAWGATAAGAVALAWMMSLIVPFDIATR